MESWLCTLVTLLLCLWRTTQWIKYFTVTATTSGLTSKRELQRYTGSWNQVGCDIAAPHRSLTHNCDRTASQILRAELLLLSWMYAGGLMVTTLRLDRLVASQKVFQSNNWRPEIYMAALRDSGFTNVQMEDRMDKSISYQAIYAKVLKCDWTQRCNKW